MQQAPNLPDNPHPQPRKASEEPLAATLLAAVLMSQGSKHGDRNQIEQGRALMKMADAAKGKMPKIPADSRMGKAIAELQKTAVAQ